MQRKQTMLRPFSAAGSGSESSCSVSAVRVLNGCTAIILNIWGGGKQNI